MRRLAMALIAIGGLSACSRTVGASEPLNPAAQRLGPIAIAIVNTGFGPEIGNGPVQIFMADGEVLNSSYWDGALSDASPLPSYPAGSQLQVGDGLVQFVASGPRTTLYCRARRTPGGNGYGQCRTVNGALWSISW